MKNEQLRESPELLRASSAARPIGVDRKANVLRGYVVAQLGLFKTGRGQFDQASLDLIVKLGNESKQGLKSRFSHPTECDDGLGKHLGRVRDLFLSEATNAEGVKVPVVRGDLHLDATAMQEPPGGGKPLGLYVMELAESDPEAISSSLVLRAKKELQLNADGTRKKDEKTGEDLPPLWRPYKLWASDIVDTGDAVDGLLSAEGFTDGLPNGVLWTATEMLDGLFDGHSRAEVADRLKGFVEKYLAMRFGAEESASQPIGQPEPLAGLIASVESLQSLVTTLERRMRFLEKHRAA